MNVKSTGRLFLDIGLTGACNLRCRFCFQARSKSQINIDGLKKLMGRLRGSSITDVSFIGGEPLLRGEEIPGLLKTAKENGLGTALATNGLLLSPESIRRIAEDLDIVQFPLDGENPGISALMRGDERLFDRTLENVRAFNQDPKFKGRIKIGVMLTALNYRFVGSIPELIIARGLSIDYLKFSQFRAFGAAIAQADVLSVPEKFVLEIMEKVRRKGPYPFVVTYSLERDNADLPRLVLKEDGKIYLGWDQEEALFDMNDFDPDSFAQTHPDMIAKLAKHNEKMFADR